MNAGGPIGFPAALPWDEALRLAATSRDTLIVRLRENEARPRLQQRIRRNSAHFRVWSWWVENSTTGETLASGRAWTQAGAHRAKHRAYVRVLGGVA